MLLDNHTLTSSTQSKAKDKGKPNKPGFSLFSPSRLKSLFYLTQEQLKRGYGSFAPTNIVDEIKQYRGQGRKIFLTLTRYWRLDVFRVSRRKIAQEVGCSVDTVSRWFTRFRKDLGIQIQQNSPYEVNEFVLPDRYRSGKVAYEIGLLKLNDTDRKLRIEKDTQITHPETVVHKDIVLLRSIKLPLSLSLPTGRDTLRGKRGILKKKNRERTPRQKRLWMIKRLLSRGQNSKAKELLYTPLMRELREKLGLTEREIFKSTAFFDVVLRDSLQWLTLQQKNQHKRQIFDFKGLFFWRCAEYSKINKWKIEKYWYREILRILYRRRIEMKEKQEGKKWPCRHKGSYGIISPSDTTHDDFVARNLHGLLSNAETVQEVCYWELPPDFKEEVDYNYDHLYRDNCDGSCARQPKPGSLKGDGLI